MQFPVNLNLPGRPVLVVGAGRVALRKVHQLLAAGADVTVVAPSILDEFADLGVRTLQRSWTAGDSDGFWLVVTATGVREVDQQIFEECEAARIWVNSADDPDRCSFTLPASFRRGSLMVTVSTGGASPALSSWLRGRLEEMIGPEYAEVTARLALERAKIHANGVSTETIDWAPIIAEVLAELGLETEPLAR